MSIFFNNYIFKVQFIDYGNIERVTTKELYHLPRKNPICGAQPIAMCCVLSEVQPDLVLNPQALWPDKVNNIFKTKTSGVLLNAKVSFILLALSSLLTKFLGLFCN